MTEKAIIERKIFLKKQLIFLAQQDLRELEEKLAALLTAENDQQGKRLE